MPTVTPPPTPKRHAPKGRLKARPDRMDALDHTDGLGYVSCTATSKHSGVRCKRRPIPGGAVCVKHGGGAPQVQRRAEERLLELQHPAITRLGELVAQGEFPSVAIAAVKDVLDRTMGRPTERVDVTLSSDEALLAAITSGRLRLARARETSLLSE
jgi:hypothetical protein